MRLNKDVFIALAESGRFGAVDCGANGSRNVGRGERRFGSRLTPREGRGQKEAEETGDRVPAPCPHGRVSYHQEVPPS